MGAENRPRLTELLLPGAASAWEKIGFAPREGAFQLGEVTCGVGADGPSWAFDQGGDMPDALCGIATAESAARQAEGDPSEQPNGAFKIDHVVVVSEAPSQTKAALERFGLIGKGARSFGSGDAERSQCFFWSGELLIELVGPAAEKADASPLARIWGVTFVVDDFAPLLALAEGLVAGPRDAIQPGRQIATVATQLELGVELAFMSPYAKRSKS